MSIAAGALLRASDNGGNLAWNASFRYDTHVMNVASTNPINGAVVTIPFTHLELNFDEAVGSGSVGADDLVLSQGSVESAAMVDADTVGYTLTGITTEGTLTVSLGAGAVTDVWGNPGAAYSGDFIVDIGTVAFPTPLTRLSPDGSLIYDGSVSASIAPGNDSDSFTLSLDAGQTLTALVMPPLSLQSVLTITGPSRAGPVTAAAAGKQVFLQTLAVPVGGMYTVTVGSANGTTGNYTLQLTLNAAVETESHDGAADDTLATAQDLSAAQIPIGSAQRAAVLGQLPGTAGTPVVTENFDAGPPLGPAWSTYSSQTTGRIQVSGLYGTAAGPYALLMDNNDSGGMAYNLNEAVWTVNLAGVVQPTLTFSFTDWYDDLDSFGGDFTGHYNADGVAISADGTTWHPIWQAVNQANPGTWQQATIDLAAQAASHGIVLGANFKIKFQQYDNYNITTDGRGYDQIAISTPAPADDWYRLYLNAGQQTTVGLATLSSGSVTVNLYDASGNLLATGVGAKNLAEVISNFLPASSGYYYVHVSGHDAAYSLVVTKGAGFDTESNDSLAAAQDVGGNTRMLGYVGPASGGPTPLLHFMPGAGDFHRGTAPPSIGLAPGGGQPVHSDGPKILAAANAFGTTYDINSGDEFLGRFALDTPQTLVSVGPQSVFIPAGDFDNSGDFSTAYAIDGDNNRLVQMDMATGRLTTIGPITPYGDEGWTGMACDPTSGIMYASSTDISASSLYTVNLTTGAATRIGAITNAPGIIALAVDDTGQVYGEDLVNDTLIRINKTTGDGTIIGPLGFDANYAQGMDFDAASQQLYIAAFNNSTIQGELRIADRTTGATVLVGPLGSTSPGSAYEMCWLGIAAGGDRDDYYRVQAVSGDHLVINATAPITGPGNPDSTLDVAVELLDPTGRRWRSVRPAR